MAAFTSSLPEKTLDQLSAMAQQLNMPKNQIIYEALTKYFFEKEQQQYIDSFERLAGDEEMMKLAEMCLDDYFDQLNELDA